MKILCPLDFSSSSVTALHYSLELFNTSSDLEITLIHCFDLASRSALFLKIDDILRREAEKDITTLIDNTKKKFPNAKISYKIYKGDPKRIIPSYEAKRDFDFVIIGTKGMTELKDIVIGSLTETLFENSSTPIIAIPDGIPIQSPKNILVALDDKHIGDGSVLHPIKKLVKETNANLHLCHVCQGGEDESFEYDPVVDVEFSGLNFDYKCLKEEGALVDVLANYANKVNAEMVTLIHRHRTWWQRLFSRSQTKEKLFNIIRPLLILNGDINESD